MSHFISIEHLLNTLLVVEGTSISIILGINKCDDFFGTEMR